MPDCTKTLVFKVRFSNPQISKVWQYLEISRHIWNHGLGCLIELEQFTRPYRDELDLDDKGKPRWKVAPCCPLPWSYRRIDSQGEWVEGNIAPYSPIQDSRRPYRQCCPLPQDYREPKLGLSLVSKFTLQYYFAQKNHPEWKDLKEMGAWYVRGVCESLYKAWSEYKSGKRGKPRFKSIRNQYRSLSYGDGAKIVVEAIAGKTKDDQPRDAKILIPKIGKVKVPYYWQDMGALSIAVLKIVQKPDGWYLQITCSKFPALEPKEATATIGLCPVGRGGVLAVDDQGREYGIQPDLRRIIDRRITLKKVIKTDRQLLKRLKKANLPSAEIEESLEQKTRVVEAPIEPTEYESLNKSHKALEGRLIELQKKAARQRAAVHRMQQASQETKGKNLAKTERKIARISALLADRRKSQREKIASFMAQRSAAIAIVKPNSAQIPHPKPQIRPGTFPAHYDPNGAEVVAALNKEKSQHGLGDFVALIKQKAAEYKRKLLESPKISRKELKKATYQSIAKAIKRMLD
jgi:putative transposase